MEIVRAELPQSRIIRRRQISGFDLSELVYRPGLKVPGHSHEHANFCIALKGTCTESYGRKVREYRPFTLDFLPPGHIHSLNFHSAELRCFSMDVSLRRLEVMREYSLRLDYSVHSRGGVLGHLFIKLYQEFRSGDQASDLCIEGLALEMLAEVARCQIATPRHKPPKWLEQARDLVQAEFSKPLTLAGLAGLVGVHPAHLVREFRKHYHSTIGERIHQLRVEYASRQLAESEVSLSEIALAAGFSDQSHFSRIFKRLTGMTPSEYRTAARGLHRSDHSKMR